MKKIAIGEFDVKLEQLSGSETAIKQMSINKQFTGQIKGSSKGTMLSAFGQVQGSAGYVALEEVSASLDGKKGTFVLQHSGTMSRGQSKLLLTVVPDSATGELAGLSGEMQIDKKADKHSYVFTYLIDPLNLSSTKREIRSDGAVHLQGDGAALTIRRLGQGVVLFELSGMDRGQFGEAPFTELAQDLAQNPSVELFIDTRAAVNANSSVSMQWSNWISANRKMQQMNVLVASKYVQLTAEIMKFFSRAESRVRIYTDPKAFQDAICASTGLDFELRTLTA